MAVARVRQSPRRHASRSRWIDGSLAAVSGLLDSLRNSSASLRGVGFPFLADATQDVSKRNDPWPTKPLIGLNADYRAAKKDSPAFSYRHAGYYDAIVEAGGIP